MSAPAACSFVSLAMASAVSFSLMGLSSASGVLVLSNGDFLHDLLIGKSGVEVGEYGNYIMYVDCWTSGRLLPVFHRSIWASNALLIPLLSSRI